MTIEIHNPELEAMLQQRLKAGNFADVEDMLLQTLRLEEGSVAGNDRKAAAIEAAAAGIRELRKGVRLDRPEGVSLREYAHIGHRY